MKKKILSLVLALAMMCAFAPGAGVFAEEITTSTIAEDAAVGIESNDENSSEEQEFNISDTTSDEIESETDIIGSQSVICTENDNSAETEYINDSSIKCESYEGEVYYLTNGKLYVSEITDDNRLFNDFYAENLIVADDKLIATATDENIEYLDVGNNTVVYKGDNLQLFSTSNEQTVFNYLVNNMGLNSAAACGVLSNIRSESNFNPNALGDSGTSYGICQWHNSRWTDLKTYCNDNGYDWTTLTGQLHFLEDELKKSYSSVWNCLCSVDNTADGAYYAAWYWCYYYEKPANKASVSVTRGNYAKNTYWPTYGNSGYNPEGVLDVCTGGSGQIEISGWAFDRDDAAQSLQIHVYIGSTDAEGHGWIVADKYRPDVNNVYGTGDYHGFSETIYTNKTGTQVVYVYAINVGEGGNVLIGQATVDITPRVTTLTAWVSDTQMGDSVDTLNSGQKYYLCYKIYDANTGEYFSNYSSKSYTAAESVYDSSGNTIMSYSYSDSDNNWIGFTPKAGGSWTGEIVLTGDISGTLTISFNVIERLSMFDLWVSDSSMGDEISKYTKNDEIYFNCELDKKYYVCYKMYDEYSGDSYNSYANTSYTVTLTFYEEDNSLIGTLSYSNTDSDSVSLTTAGTGIVTCKAVISGDISGEVSVYLDISEAAQSLETYTVTYNYDYNGGTSATKTTTSVVSGGSADLTPTAYKSGSTFVGWNTNKDAQSAITEHIVTADTTLYAIYKKAVSVTLVDVNGIRTINVDIYNNYDAATAASLCGYSGWTALGWRNDTKADDAVYTGSISYTDSITVYAVYERDVTLTYNANGGSGTPSTQTQKQYYNAFGNMSTGTFTIASSISRDGYIFEGWAQDSISGTKYNAGDTISITEDTTLYALWSEVSDDAEYPYIINDISLSSTDGNEISTFPKNTAFVATANFMKIQERNAADYLVLAVYSSEGELIDMDYTHISSAKDDECDIAFTVPAQSKTIGKIKVFIWDSLGNMTPLTESYN